MTERNITFRVRRYNPEKDERPYYQEFTVPIHKGMTVLDGLHYIKREIDNSLAWRYSCRMGVCGSCAMLVNGKAMLACNTQITDISETMIVVAPLPNFSIIRDLVPDLAGMFSKHQSVQPFIQRTDEGEMVKPTGEYEQSPEELESYLQFSYCIRCGACMSACPTLATDQDYLGPMPLTQAFRYNSDSRDDGKKPRNGAVDTPHGAYRCHFGSECSRVCPKGVDPAKAIQLMKRQLVFDFLGLLKKPAACTKVITEPRTTGRREGIPEAPPFTIEQS
ncbi:MAG TPA: succinate dehydrogenase iron-sulfur subunit [Thermoanaerobaculia bacterium]|nr:succinate dehydrogenase iron-sulfur subunit [Thermoanaerobaculia bacterium]HUM29639.1 succinate dehydrogenase iron-sulfur subunit [Thermoanaerobaculia bacterium]HXK67290.1 succinate dehydrogenase iron-sulfur subunit [Thermoanaerobaculia bacterium]